MDVKKVQLKHNYLIWHKSWSENEAEVVSDDKALKDKIAQFIIDDPDFMKDIIVYTLTTGPIITVVPSRIEVKGIN